MGLYCMTLKSYVGHSRVPCYRVPSLSLPAGLMPEYLLPRLRVVSSVEQLSVPLQHV